MKQTAVECLAKEIQEQLNMFFPDATLYQPTIDKAKEMEKEQMIEFFMKGQNTYPSEYVLENKQIAEQYYNETFKSE
jgi:hypothetical protein